MGSCLPVTYHMPFFLGSFLAFPPNPKPRLTHGKGQNPPWETAALQSSLLSGALRDQERAVGACSVSHRWMGQGKHQAHSWPK